MNRMRGRGLILAAPSSGSGKTLVTAGLLGALRRRGLLVAAAKAGPDYIDPTFHAMAATGGPCRNLDLWAMRPATLSGLVARLESEAEIVLCEGVMGLFDGTGADGETGSTAALARTIGWPVVLVVDAGGQGASAAALVAGFARHDPSLQLVGVIFNRVSGARHRALIEAAMVRRLPEVACLGSLPHDRSLTLPERHLGLVPAGEAAAAQQVIARAASAVEAGLDLDRLIALARTSEPERHPIRLNHPPIVMAGPGPAIAIRRHQIAGSSPAMTMAGDRISADYALAQPTAIAPLPPLGARIAVARDDAFLFAYPAVLEGWRQQGAELSFFSPLADQAPEAADAVYLPGGYPELHAGRLASAACFLAGLRRAAADGAAVYGECGGFMVLGETLTDADGRVHPMAGLLPLRTSFAERRLHLGYRDLTLLSAGPLGAAGARFRGHEFHYSTTVAAAGGAAPLFAVADASGNDLGTAGQRRGTVTGSFIHLIDRADG